MSRLAQIIWLVSSLVSGSAFAQNDIRWAPDLATARRAAAQFQVPLMVHFYGDNCLPCKTLEQRVFSQDSVVKTLNKYFICVRVNASQERSIAADYQVHSWPTDVFVSPDGQVLFQGVCKQDIAGYMEVLQTVAVSNRDRNTMIASERSKQAAAQNQVASNISPNQPNAQSSSLPPISSQPSNSPFVAPPAIAASTPSAQFQIAPPTQPKMMESEVGLLPRASHLTSKPLGSDGLGTRDNVSGQLNAQANMPRVVTVSNNNQKPSEIQPTASLVSNPYYPESEAMVCTPDGKCGPASSMVQTVAQPSNPMTFASEPKTVPNKTMHLVSDTQVIATAPQFPPLPSNSGTTTPATNSNVVAPTFQPRSAISVSNPTTSTAEQTLPGLIETTQTPTEPAAYNGYCPIALVKSGSKVQGSVANAVRHRGRTYLMESPEAVAQFMQSPDRYSPVLSGYDPMIFLESGTLVDGVLEHALHDPTSGTIILFANAESQAKFKAEPARNTKALGYILNAVNKK